MATVRVLQPGDEEALLAFLEGRPDTTMFLRSNLREAGIVDRGEQYQGTYVAAFEGDRVVSVASHYWMGNLNLEAPVHLAEVVGTALRESGRGLRGLIGAWDYVAEARRLLHLEDVPTMMDSREELYRLELDALRVPEALATGRMTCHRACEEDVDVLAAWRVGYDVETLGGAGDERARARSLERARDGIADGRVWVLRMGGQPVSMTGFNAVLPDCVQVGGVWTPPELRSRGYARAAVAGSLLEARAEGAVRSILFTGEDNHPARACYQKLGYEIVGDYGIVLFAGQHWLAR